MSTIRSWENQGRLLASFRTPGAHRRFKLDAIHKACGFQLQRNSRITICFARVSSHDQKEDLERQKIFSRRLVRGPSRKL